MRLRISQEDAATRTVELSGKSLTIGRESSCGLRLDDQEVSREHARLRILADGAAELEDAGSRNGTYVDGRRISGPVVVSPKQEIRIGTTLLTLESEGREADPRPAPAQPASRPSAIRRTQSALQQALMQRSVRRATGIAAIAVMIAAVAIVLAVTGVFRSEPPNASDVVAEVRSSTIDVSAEKNGRQVGGGSGWVLDAEQGLIVTNAHVVGAGETFSAGLQGQMAAASVVGVAVCDDLAVLEVDQTAGLTEMRLGSQSELQQGDRVFVVGFPANASNQDELTVTQGIVSIVMARADTLAVIDPDFQIYPNVIQTDAAINGGNSGGPLVNEDGELVGVNTFTAGGENEGYSIGVDRVKELLGDLRTGVSQAWAGFDFHALSVKDQQQLGFGGLEVTTAVQGTSGAKAGFGQGDALITKVNGVPVTSREDYCNALDGVSSGETATFSGLQASGPRFNIKIPLE